MVMESPKYERDQLRVIGVGASAGGLEALQALLEPCPADYPAAIVVIQHLAPDHASMTAELLGRHTSLKVVKATCDTKLESGTAYVLEPKTVLSLHGDTILVEPRDDAMRLHRPIDRFLASLAEERGEHAYAVILSGTGSDGTDGARAVKEAGGFVVAQSPDSARFDGMPRSVINARCHDLCLSPEEILSRIEQITSHEVKAFTQSPATLESVLKVLVEHEDVDLSNYREATVRRRVERRIALSRSETVSAYVALLREDRSEREALVGDLFIGVTRFFRDMEAFERLREVIRELPNTVEPLRCWICGCSTGEEAYSVGMLLWQELLDRSPKREFKIFATDVSDSAIRRASRGEYSAESMREVPAEQQARFFRRNDDGYFVCDSSLRNRIVFSQHDALRDPPFSRLDLVVCRNMLIYLQPDAQHQLINGFSFSLKQGGLLWLGPSESGADKAAEFAAVDTKWRIFQNKAPRRGPRLDWKMRAPPVPSQNRMHGEVLPSARRAEIDWHKVHDDLSEGFLPSHFLINDQYRLLYQHGTFARQLLRFPEGESTTDIRALLAPSLRPAVESLVAQGLRGEEAQARRLAYEGSDETVNLRARGVGGRNNLMALFVERGNASDQLLGEEASEPKVLDLTDIEADLQRRVESLEHDILITRESLQNTVEELESSNEELQATNEELLASNEELQSVNEELQSVNEELHTVNMEHQQKIIELGTLNTDLDTLLATVDHGVLFLDGELRVRRFNPRIQDYMAVMEGDIGRPLGHFTHALSGFPFLEACARCLREKEPLEEIVDTSPAGATLLVRLRPLVGNPGHDGVVISITDITNLERLRETNQNIRTALDSINLPVALIAESGEVEYANPSLAELAGRDARYLSSTQASDLIAPEQLKIWEQAVVQVSSGKSWEGYLQMRRPDQSNVGELVRIAPIFGRNKKRIRGMVRITLVHSRTAEGAAHNLEGTNFLAAPGAGSERRILGLIVRDLAAGGEARKRALQQVEEEDADLLMRALKSCDEFVVAGPEGVCREVVDLRIWLGDGQTYRVKVLFEASSSGTNGWLEGIQWVFQGQSKEISP